MATYAELSTRYKKRQKDTLVDTIATGLTLTDEITVGLDLFDSYGTFETILENVCDVIPLAIVAVTEGQKVVFGKKKASIAASDMAFRSVKSGTAMAVGAGVATIAGGLVALPAALSTRFLFDQFKSKALLARRLEKRVETMQFLREKWKPQSSSEMISETAPEPAMALAT